MANNPFSVLGAAEKLQNRGRQVDSAVEKAAPAAKPDSTVRDNKVRRVYPSSYAPRAGQKAAEYGTPMGVEAPQPESAAERAARGQTNPGQ
jgi:hypothetical protein